MIYKKKTIIFSLVVWFCLVLAYSVQAQSTDTYPRYWTPKYGADWQVGLEEAKQGRYSGKLITDPSQIGTAVSLDSAVWQYYDVTSSFVLYFRDADNDGFGDQAATDTVLEPGSNPVPAGYSPTNDDCDDTNPSVKPSADEACDNLDNNCNYSVDEGCDKDNDNYCDSSILNCVGTPSTCSSGGCTVRDCDDNNPNLHPGATEVCGNALDEDCFAGDEVCPCTTDNDADGYGIGSGCLGPDCDDNKADDPAGCPASPSLCNLSNPTHRFCAVCIHPGVSDICDTVNNDCSPTPDGSAESWYGTFSGNCGQGVCLRAGVYTCVSGSQQATCTPGSSTGTDNDCNNLDNDCDGLTDEHYVASPATCGLGVCEANGSWLCTFGTIHLACTPNPPTDTNDDVCNSLDDDCDGFVDEDANDTYYRDADGDGFGNPSQTQTTCPMPAGYVANSSDCNDSDFNIKPGVAESCTDNIDNNCNASADCADTACFGTPIGTCGTGTCAGNDTCNSNGSDTSYCSTNGNNCNDSNACTSGETCSSGACSGGSAVNCSDADACNGIETCNTSTGCVSGTPLVCSDGNQCNGTETCNASTGCVSGTPLVCSDGNQCNGTETCNASTGCVVGTPLTCDDSNQCNGTETCNASTGCVSGTPLVCSDGNQCNGTETCNPASGCQSGTALTCDDGNLCNGTETCNPASGCVAGTPPSCSDSIICTADSCSAGACVHTPNNSLCSDSNVCTNDTCDVATGCVFTNNTATCSDGNSCTVGDVCASGSCTPGGPKDTDGDGYIDQACGGDDCDDGNINRNPGLYEFSSLGRCSDGIDNDCDSFIDANDSDCNLVAWYQMNENTGQTVYDETTLHDGYLGSLSSVDSRDPGTSSPGAGSSGYYTVYNGSQGVSIPHSTAFELQGNFSISGWFYRPACTVDATCRHLYFSGFNEDGTWAKNNGYGLEVDLGCSASCDLAFGLHCYNAGAGNYSLVNSSKVPSLSNVSPGWHHLAVTHSNTAIVRYYLDGSLIHTISP